LDRHNSAASRKSIAELGMNKEERKLYRIMKQQYGEEDGAIKQNRKQSGTFKRQITDALKYDTSLSGINLDEV
jgi:hypothetical protein